MSAPNVVDEYSAGRRRRVLVVEHHDRWYLATGEHTAPLGSYRLDGPFDSLSEAQKVALSRHARSVANDVGRRR